MFNTFVSFMFSFQSNLELVLNVFSQNEVVNSLVNNLRFFWLHRESYIEFLAFIHLKRMVLLREDMETLLKQEFHYLLQQGYLKRFVSFLCTCSLSY